MAQPDFDYSAMTEAMASVENAEFVVWRKK
jgi:hypothetical protein